jgi:hypothetical protein
METKGVSAGTVVVVTSGVADGEADGADAVARGEAVAGAEVAGMTVGFIFEFFTVTIQTSFFPAVFAVIFAFPLRRALTTPFLETEAIFFLEDFQTTFFLVPFTFSFFVCPTLSDIFFALSRIFAFACVSAGITEGRRRLAASTTAVAFAHCCFFIEKPPIH